MVVHRTTSVIPHMSYTCPSCVCADTVCGQGFLFHDAVVRITHDHEDITEKPMFVFVFSALNLVLDIVQAIAITTTAITTTITTITTTHHYHPSSHTHHHHVIQVTLYFRYWWREEDAITNVNLLSAAAHVFADTIRTLSEMVSSSLAVWCALDPVTTDAWASFLVNFVVLVSAVGLMLSTLAHLSCHAKKDQVHAYEAVP